MNSSKLFLPILLLLLVSSCATETEDCICTQEYRTIIVIILDESGTPVEGLTTSISDEKGNFYDIEKVYPLAGYYPVMSDKYVREFSTIPKKILFTAVSATGEVNGEFFINTDRCKCHVQKVSGPDTLVLK